VKNKKDKSRGSTSNHQMVVTRSIVRSIDSFFLRGHESLR